MSESQKFTFWFLLPTSLIGLMYWITTLLWTWSPVTTLVWFVFLLVVISIILYESVYFLRPDTMILASFLGTPYKVYSPLKDDDPGWLGGIIIIFPPFLAVGQFFPITGIEVPLESSSAITDDVTADSGKGLSRDPATPVTVFARLMIQLPTDIEKLRQFVQAIPVIQNYWNLMAETEMEFLVRIEPTTGKPDIKPRKVPCIAKIMRDAIDGTFDEAIGRAVAEHPFSKALKNRKEIEDATKDHMAGIEERDDKKAVKEDEVRQTLASEAGIFFYDNVLKGRSTNMRLADFNIAGIIPSNEKTMVALSAEQEAIRIANGREAEGRGEAAIIKQVAVEVDKLGGREALASRTLREIKTNVTIVAASDMLTAAIGNSIAPKPAPSPPPATPPQQKGGTP